jgi:hypothetical protein
VLAQRQTRTVAFDIDAMLLRRVGTGKTILYSIPRRRRLENGALFGRAAGVSWSVQEKCTMSETVQLLPSDVSRTLEELSARIIAIRDSL